MNEKTTPAATEIINGTIFPVYGGLYGSFIHYLDIDELATDPRRRIGADCVRAFSGAIAERGFLRPVFVDGDLAVVDGQKRIAAARALGYTAVPCVFAPTPLVFEDDLLICRLIRESPDFFAYADVLSRLKDVYLYSQEAIAGALGKSQSFVANKLRLLKFTPEERGIIKGAGLTERHCRALLSLRDEEARRRALDVVVSDGLSVAATEELASSFSREDYPSRLKSFESDLRRLAAKYAQSGTVELYKDRSTGTATFTLKMKE